MPTYPVPLTVWLYVALSFGTFFYVALVPGPPAYMTTGFPWLWLGFTALLAIVVVRGSRAGWIGALVYHLLVLAVHLIATASPWPGKLYGLILLSVAIVAVLLTPSIRHHMVASRSGSSE